MGPLYRYPLGGLRQVIYREPVEEVAPPDNSYVTEDGTQSYGTEDGTDVYIPET